MPSRDVFAWLDEEFGNGDGVREVGREGKDGRELVEFVHGCGTG